MGCCGSKRQQVVQKIYGSQGYSASAGLRASAQDSMRAAQPAVAETPAGMPHFATPAGVPFVYDGLAALVVTGSATGRRYRFAARGVRLMVDPLDAPTMRQTPKLRCLA
ncbi:hypothetical protein [Pseudoduganella aquatica]|uniref:Uncharacterized protein n=1 Tax=Pseudoduganella aquatica TaxID=2660641 RepID=A0A7X4HBU4_9BURK|nr:hypothetical protein [Pseudoduganella aquatica]MYN07988.1 hypothetical protein [Pseudoduganella aquatica]